VSNIGYTVSTNGVEADDDKLMMMISAQIFNQQIILHADACHSGLGAVLYQPVDCKRDVIAYASRSLNKAE